MKIIDFNLSKREYYVDFYLTPIVLLALVVKSFAFVPFVLGLIGWTIFEYLFHRFILHNIKTLHQAHHDNPDGYVAPSSFITLTAFSALYGVLAALGTDNMMSGILAGYFIYIIVHDRSHHGHPKHNSVLGYLKRKHQQHHYLYDKNYSVSMPVWDVLLGTNK
jgi:cyclopropane-fatty-acyl-phospholipid synthase